MKRVDDQDKLIEAVDKLLSQYWIVKEQDEEGFALIKKFETKLKQWFREKFGYQLIIHKRMFARLEKIPVKPEAWMGIDPEFIRDAKDYAILFLLLAFFENRYEESFLVSEFCEELRLSLAEERFLENYYNRLSLIRVFKYATKNGLLIHREGDIEFFKDNKENEVLYKISGLARYYIRTLPVTAVEARRNPSLLLEPAWIKEEARLEKRHRVYRQLLLTPGILFSRGSIEDRSYIRNQFGFLLADFRIHTPYSLELFREAIICIKEEAERFDNNVLPNNGPLSDILLQFSSVIRREIDTGTFPMDEHNDRYLSRASWELLFSKTRELYKHLWNTDYEQTSPAKILKQCEEYMLEWGLIDLTDSYSIRITPYFMRIAPYIQGKGEKQNVNLEA